MIFLDEEREWAIIRTLELFQRHRWGERPREEMAGVHMGLFERVDNRLELN